MAFDGRKKGGTPQVSLMIVGIEVGDVNRFHWISMVDNGYIIRARVQDPYYNIMRQLVGPGEGGNGYVVLKGARKEPEKLEIKFKIRWTGGDWTNDGKPRKAIITNLASKGDPQNGYLEFVAVDPASWWLNGGYAAGKIYTGNVSDVVQQVVNEFASSVTLDIDETEDSKNNKWQMMRIDPRNFIMSLLDWSASVTKKKTAWVVNSHSDDDGDRLWIKELATVAKKDYGEYIVNTTGGGATEVPRLETLSDMFLTVTQTNIVTQGLSAVTGKYIDKITSKDNVIIKDSNTGNKINTEFGQDRGYAKPDDDKKWSTGMVALPEHNAGDVGIKYEDYIDGRARGAFIRLLNMVMRAKLTVIGDPKFHSNQHLGAATIDVVMNDIENDIYFLSGKWLVHGFHHVISGRGWVTNLYVSRLDFDANAQKV